MLLPRFSLRAILGVLTLGAFVFLVAGMAVRGQTWAWGITIAVICAGITLLVHAAWFGIVWLFAQMPSAQAATEPARKHSIVALEGGTSRTSDTLPVNDVRSVTSSGYTAE